MSTWAARYVRLADRGRDMPRLKASMGAGTSIHDDGKSPFVVCPVVAPKFAPDDLTALSRDFGEALCIAVQTVADLVVYDHFVGGARVRGLTYAGEAGWVRVVGAAEPWEPRALFSSVKLAELIDELEDDLTDEEIARETAELERLWALGVLREGSTRPPAEPLALARAIEKQYGLPARPSK